MVLGELHYRGHLVDYRVDFPSGPHLPRLTAMELRRGITFTPRVPLGSDETSLLSPVRLLRMLRASTPTPPRIAPDLKEPRITRACSTRATSNAVIRKMTVIAIRTSDVLCVRA